MTEGQQSGSAEDLRPRILAELEEGFRLLRAPPDHIELARSGDVDAIYKAYDAMERAPLGYIVALSSWGDTIDDEDTLRQLVEMNEFVRRVIGDAKTPEEVEARLTADYELAVRLSREAELRGEPGTGKWGTDHLLFPERYTSKSS